MFRKRKGPPVPFEYSELLNPEAYLQQKYPPQREVAQLSRDHRNDIFRIIESCGIPVAQFKLDTFIMDHPNMWHDYDHPVKCQVTVIRYPPTRAIFCIRPNPIDPYSRQEFEVREDSERGATAEDLFHDPRARQTFEWEDVKSRLDLWARMISYQVNGAAEYESTPDLWDTLPDENPDLGGL
jgi:hypothetical protein